MTSAPSLSGLDSFDLPCVPPPAGFRWLRRFEVVRVGDLLCEIRKNRDSRWDIEPSDGPDADDVVDETNDLWLGHVVGSDESDLNDLSEDVFCPFARKRVPVDLPYAPPRPRTFDGWRELGRKETIRPFDVISGRFFGSEPRIVNVRSAIGSVNGDGPPVYRRVSSFDFNHAEGVPSLDELFSAGWVVVREGKARYGDVFWAKRTVSGDFLQWAHGVIDNTFSQFRCGGVYAVLRHPDSAKYSDAEWDAGTKAPEVAKPAPVFAASSLADPVSFSASGGTSGANHALRAGPDLVYQHGPCFALVEPASDPVVGEGYPEKGVDGVSTGAFAVFTNAEAARRYLDALPHGRAKKYVVAEVHFAPVSSVKSEG